MFDITTHFDSNYDKELVWNCRYCTNLTYGCKKCAAKKSDNKYTTFTCRSFQYYIFHKIRCECLGEGCKNCKNQGFIVERIHNYKNHKNYYEDKIGYKAFTEKYTIIEEENWNHFKCLSVFFIPPSEKERLKKDILQHARFKESICKATNRMLSDESLMNKIVAKFMTEPKTY